MNKFQRIISDYDFNKPNVLSPDNYYDKENKQQDEKKVQRLSKGTRCETTETE